MQHTDLAEDVLLAVLVATTTVATLYVGWYVGWRSGRGASRRGEESPTRDGGEDGRDPSIGEPAGRESVSTWNRRLRTEHARSVRHGGSSTVVALRIGKRRGPLGRRTEPDVTRSIDLARRISGRSRASDVVRVTGDGLIRVLLVETGEDGARVYVDRLSESLAADPDAEGDPIVAAWASIAPSRDLPAANRLAIARLQGATLGWLRSLAVHRSDQPGERAASRIEPRSAQPPNGSPG